MARFSPLALPLLSAATLLLLLLAGGAWAQEAPEQAAAATEEAGAFACFCMRRTLSISLALSLPTLPLDSGSRSTGGY